MDKTLVTYYQDLSKNAEFVAAYLIAVKSIVSKDSALFGPMPQMIIDLSALLFEAKPLNRTQMVRTNELLRMYSVHSKLMDTNEIIINQASGLIATKLLGFINGSRSTNDQVQLATVCASLRKSAGEASPTHEQALRRAAAWGRLYELKVLIKSMSKLDIDKKDDTYGRSALLWAVSSKQLDCARELVKASVSLDSQDKDGQTALHKAVKNADKPMIKMLIEAGASLSIPDKQSVNPVDCTADSDTKLFISHCHYQVSTSDMH